MYIRPKWIIIKKERGGRIQIWLEYNQYISGIKLNSSKEYSPYIVLDNLSVNQISLILCDKIDSYLGV